MFLFLITLPSPKKVESFGFRVQNDIDFWTRSISMFRKVPGCLLFWAGNLGVYWGMILVNHMDPGAREVSKLCYLLNVLLQLCFAVSNMRMMMEATAKFY